jgi:hypothetical protein
MNSWIKEIKEAAKYDTEYTKKYGELILYNMFQELEYLRLTYFAKDFDYGNEIDQVIAIYKIDVQMCRLMEMPKYRKMIDICIDCQRFRTVGKGQILPYYSGYLY